MEKQRIAYIDAMRGFTMVLVVFAHVCHFCLGDSRMGYNAVFILFRLPCFFMLSGWLFEPVCCRPFRQIVRKKFMVQIVPTFIFLLLLAPPPEFFHQLGTLKGGYWFTFVLFEFFILYMVIVRMGRTWTPILVFAITIASFVYARYYDSLRSSAEGYQLLIIDMLGFLSVTAWRLFLFFYVGAWMRRHFDTFIRWTNKPVVILLVTASFFLIASTSHKDNLWFEMFRYYAGGITGMWMVFTLFRLSASWLKKSRIEKPMQYVGTRTLDIYLLHFFFLPRFLMEFAPQLQAYDSRILEFLVIMAISLIILLLCLTCSYIIRLSPFLAKYLFGVKQSPNP
ncbi:MAG: acyltransferase family protein [Prevotella sp.]|nr:acyltransferase family protein [Prevotella sp.]